MSTTTYIRILLLISKHEREGRLTIERGCELQKLFKSCYEKGVSSKQILEVLK